MRVTLELSPNMAQKLHELAQGQTSDAQTVARDLLAQIPSPSSVLESDLLVQINALGLPEAVWARYDALLVCRREETLSEAERTELLGLIAQIEQNHTEQIRLAAQLAFLKNKPLPIVLHEMGLGPRPVPFS